MTTALTLPTARVPGQPNSRVLQVGTGCTYTTIGAAITAANTLTRTATSQVVLEIWPGTYTETITLPTWTSVLGRTDGIVGDVQITNATNASTITLPTLTAPATSAHFIKNIRVTNTSDTNGTSPINQPTGTGTATIYIDNCHVVKTMTAASSTHAYTLINLGSTNASCVYGITNSIIQGFDFAGTVTLTLRGVNVGGGTCWFKNVINSINLTAATTAAVGLGFVASSQLTTFHVDGCTIRATGPTPGGGGTSTITGISTTVGNIVGDPSSVIGNYIDIEDGEINIGVLANAAACEIRLTSNVLRILTGGASNTGITDGGAAAAVINAIGNQVVAATAKYVATNVGSIIPVDVALAAGVTTLTTVDGVVTVAT